MTIKEKVTKEKIIKGKIKFTTSRRLKDGTYRETIKLTKDMSKVLFNEAMRNNTLTLSDLEYQAAGRNNTSFYQLVVAAQLVKKLGEFVERTIKETTGKEPKVTKDLRLNIK